jgi:DNA-binding MarR family transcriptional regulator
MSSHHEFLGICRTVALWQSRADAELGGVHGISLSDFTAMHHLSEAPGGRLRRVDLAHRMALTPSGVTRLLAPLERRGLVTREEGGRDARATYAALTRSGKALVRDATATVAAFADSTLGALGERDRAAFAKLAAL